MLPDVPSPGTANAPPPQPDAASVAAASGASIELGAGLRGVPFVPGRYATVIHRRLSGTHARQLVRETSSASLALTLAADGAAQACRGWRYAMTNDGPQVHTDDRSASRRASPGAGAPTAMRSSSSSPATPRCVPRSPLAGCRGRAPRP
jgi:hypothetical protein